MAEAETMTAEPKASATMRVQASLRCQGVATVAKAIGCTPTHLSYIMHGKKKANPTLRERLARLGITTTVEGVPL